MDHDNDNEIFEILSNIDDKEQMRMFLDEVLTKKEVKDLRLRWRLLRMIEQKIPQREIASRLGISLCKITRGSRLLKDKETVTYQLLKSKDRHTL
jgi:TrpR family transcriptional regulator, trp operon repressor